MSAEQQPKGKSPSLARRIGDSRLAHTLLRDTIMPRMEPMVFAAIQPEYPKGFDQAYQELIQKGYVPVFLMNHQSHGDGIPASVVAGRLTELAQQAIPEQPLQGFYLVISSTVRTGDQGKFLQAFTQFLEPHFAKRHMWLLPYTRKTDAIKFNTKTNRIETLKRMSEYLVADFGLGFFPEAHMDGGRWKSWRFWEGINGMRVWCKTPFSLS